MPFEKKSQTFNKSHRNQHSIGALPLTKNSLSSYSPSLKTIDEKMVQKSSLSFNENYKSSKLLSSCDTSSKQTSHKMSLLSEESTPNASLIHNDTINMSKNSTFKINSKCSLVVKKVISDHDKNIPLKSLDSYHNHHNQDSVEHYDKSLILSDQKIKMQQLTPPPESVVQNVVSSNICKNDGSKKNCEVISLPIEQYQETAGSAKITSDSNENAGEKSTFSQNISNFTDDRNPFMESITVKDMSEDSKLNDVEKYLSPLYDMGKWNQKSYGHAWISKVKIPLKALKEPFIDLFFWVIRI